MNAGFMSATDPQTLIVQGASLLAIGIAAWLFVSVASWRWALRNGRDQRWLRRLTLPLGRRLAELTMAATTVTLSACSAPQSPTPTLDHLGPAPTTTTTTTVPTTATTATPAPVPAPVPAPTPEPEEHHIVRRGENLWQVAELALEVRLGRPVTDAEIAPYWRAVIDENRSSLQSGDVDLVFPGERIVLPAILS